MSELGYLICQDLDICLVEGFLGFLLEAASLNGCMFLLLNCNNASTFPIRVKGATYGDFLMMTHPLVQFLKDEMSFPSDSIALAVQHAEQTPSLLPMILWRYGLISIGQLEEIFDWLEHAA
jgi:Protein of unknown function (DUF2949)